MKHLALLATLAAACGGRAPEAKPPAKPPAEVPGTTPPPAKPVEEVTLAEVGLDADKMDRAADPCEDFYRFACGGWYDKAVIPGDLGAWSAVAELKRKNDDVIKEALEEAARGGSDDPAMQKLGAYHRACMDDTAIEKMGTRPIAQLLHVVAKVRDIPSLGAAIAELHKNRIFVLFEIDSEQDYKKSSEVIGAIGQAGLGLPDRDYYLGDDDAAKKTRAAYKAHVERMLRLVGQPAGAAASGAAAVLEIETALARAQKSQAELRDVHGTYNRLDRAGLARTAPALGWDAYFRALGRADLKAIRVEAPAYIEKLNVLLSTVSPAHWRSYLAYHLAVKTAPYLPRRFADEEFALQRILSGVKEPPERWRRCAGFADTDVGELVAQPFVKKVLTPEARDAAEGMVKELTRVFGRSLAGVSWMDAATQEKAIGKLGKLELQVGYPPRWRVYEFTVDEKSFAGTHLAAARFEMARRLDKIGRPVDRGEFKRTPQQVNASYDPSLNKIVLLAGILQPPFYSAQASVAVNLGAMGMVVGHELTHGFDDQGAQFDGDGNLSSWWPDDVNSRFRERTQCVARAYSQLEVLPGINVNGELTLGENIADIGGVRMAYRAYRSLRKDVERAQVAGGLSEDQQFFLALGQAWCSKETEPYLRRVATTDPHAIKRWRINGSLRHLREFSRAFQCKSGSAMNPEDKCEVW